MPRKKKSEPPKEEKTVSELLERWRHRVSRAQKIREDWEREWKVNECEQYLIGKQKIGQGPIFNHILAAVETTKPNIFYGNPKFYVRPKPGKDSPIAEADAALAEGILDDIGTQDDNFQNAASLAVWQLFTRIGVIKACYDPTLSPNPAAGHPIFLTNEAGEPILNEAKEPVPMQDPKTGLPIMEPDMIMDDEAYSYKWVDAKNMLLPDAGPDMSKWPWIGEEVVVSLEEAKEDTRFKKEFRDQLVSNESSEKKGRRSRYAPSQEDDKDTENLRYIECYDLKKKKFYIWADGQEFDEFLVEDDLPQGIEDHPYAICPGFIKIMNPEPSPWPLPLIFPWMPVQDEYNIRRKQITEGAKRSARKVYYDQNTFPNADEATKALQSSEDMAAVQVNNVAKPPVGITDPPLPSDIHRDIPLLLMDFRIISGQTGPRMASSEDTTATEASYAERAANLRESEMLKEINLWLSVAGRKMLKLCKATLTLDRMIQLRGFTDEEFMKYAERVYGIPREMIEFLPGLKETFKLRYGKQDWKKVTREDLQFEADVTVVPGSFRPHNLDVERSQWLQFLQVIGQFPQLALSRELLRETASKFEYISERMLDELTALAQKMIAVNANQAGRGGTENGGGDNGASSNGMQAMAGMMGGMS